MRKKILRIAKATANQPKQIITFDNPIYGQILLQQQTTNKSLNLNKEIIQKQANILKLSAVNANTVTLTSRQIGSEFPLVAIHKYIDYDQKQKRMAWINQKYNKFQDYKIFHQPIIIQGQELIEEHEESISFPFFHFKILRYNKINFIHRNGLGQKVQQSLSGPSARALQQSIDQIQGKILLDWRINHGNISFLQQSIKYFPKTVSTFQEYVSDLKKIFEDYPKLIYKVPSFTNPKQRINQLQNEIISFEGDYYKRICKHYARQMQSLQERIKTGTLDVDYEQQSKLKEKQIKVKKIKK